MRLVLSKVLERAREMKGEETALEKKMKSVELARIFH